MEYLTSLDITSTSGFLVLGFLIGMVHAFEADHMAAIGTLAADNKKRMFFRGAIWGLGHTTMLFVMSVAAVLFSVILSQSGAAAVEFAVGAMLLFLGLQVIMRMRKKHVHFHIHSHDGARPHMHFHSHENDTVKHEDSPHEHSHAKGFPIKAFIIGLMHGAAGSGAIIVLAAAATGNAWAAIGYVILVGVGSIFGMALLSAAISLPFGFTPKNARYLHNGLQLTVGVFAMAIGVDIMLETVALASGVF